MTTPENVAFFLEHDIEPDNGRMARFTPDAELVRIASDHGINFYFSDKHIVHPHDLRFFEPKGHPMAAMKRAKYARKKREQSLWVMVTGRGGAAAVVRSLTLRPFAKEIHQIGRAHV